MAASGSKPPGPEHVAAHAVALPIVLLAVDWVRWSGALQKGALEIQQRAKEELKATGVALEVTGKVSDQAKRELKTLGFAVTENVPRTATANAAPPAK